MSTRQILKVENVDTDIVVIGFGGCGGPAAATAAEKGARVIILEKLATNGGNARFAYGIFAAESQVQKRHEIDVHRDMAFKISMEWAHWKNDPRIVRAFIDKSGDTIKWLEDMGIKFARVTLMYKYFNIPTYHEVEKPGFGHKFTEVLRKKCEDLGVQMFFNCQAKEILTNDMGEVTGVLAETQGKELRINAKSVIIATGGFGGNKELLKKNPYYSVKLSYSGLPQNTGDGIPMAKQIGAATEEPGAVMLSGHAYKSIHSFDAPSFLCRSPQTVWVNKNGERFCSEWLADHSYAVYRQPDHVLYSLLDEKLKNMFMEEQHWTNTLTGPWNDALKGHGIPNLDNELREGDAKGDIKIANSWGEIAEWMGVSPEVLEATIEEYNDRCDQGYDPIFNKERRYLYALRTPPYYAITAHQDFHTAIGTIKINHRMEVLNKQGKPIPGLYAGGDTCASWTSDVYPIVMSGSAVSFAISSGRIAAENAVKYLSS